MERQTERAEWGGGRGQSESSMSWSQTAVPTRTAAQGRVSMASCRRFRINLLAGTRRRTHRRRRLGASAPAETRRDETKRDEMSEAAPGGRKAGRGGGRRAEGDRCCWALLWLGPHVKVDAGVKRSKEHGGGYLGTWAAGTGAGAMLPALSPISTTSIGAPLHRRGRRGMGQLGRGRQ
ncbi:hypothetical protein BDW02DRAFT_87760 [Decorospora gaudefroyi]|uniref:Uncharacterized protein n=1 Tax=Decorospora gaudefroyi TaxID=184978 RepID=A0A6A5K1V6_9PLEO|nr:hypothetical protein BDW02DRAFT_87760 [Decorospora gaudefroyi]